MDAAPTRLLPLRSDRYRQDVAVTAHPRPYYYLENFAVALDPLRSRYR